MLQEQTNISLSAHRAATLGIISVKDTQRCPVRWAVEEHVLAEPLRAARPGHGFPPRGDGRMRRAGTGAGLSPRTQPPRQRGVQQPHTVRVREQAAMGDAELRRVSMATQPGEPPELGLKERGEQRQWKAPARARPGINGTVLGPVQAQHRRGSQRAPAWGTGGPSRTRRVVLQPRRNLGCDGKETLISLGDPKGF